MQPIALMIILYVADCRRALAFYRDAIGLDVVDSWEGWARLKCGGAFLGLHAMAPGAQEGPTRHAGLNVQVEDLDKAVAAAVGGGAVLKGIEDPRPHVPIRLAILSDPDGNVFEMHQRYDGT